MKIRGLILLAGCMFAFALASPAEAKRYKVVKNANGTYYVSEVGQSFWYKVTHPWNWIMDRERDGYPEGFGKAIRPADMNKSSTMLTETANTVDKTVDAVNGVPVVGDVTSPVSRFLKLGKTSSQTTRNVVKTTSTPVPTGRKR